MSALDAALSSGTTVGNVLHLLVDEYYGGCKSYAAAPRPDSSSRVFWRVRLGALQKYGSLLAEAIGQAEPDWEAMRELAESAVEDESRDAALVAYATAPRGALTGLPRPVRCARCDLPIGVCRCFEEWLARSAEVFGG